MEFGLLLLEISAGVLLALIATVALWCIDV